MVVKKNVEVVGAIEHAIYKLKELERSVYHGEVIVQDIRVGNQYLAQDGNGLLNISIDIDYEINQKKESRKDV